MRALWKGSLSFGLVNIPVKLYTTAESGGIKFKQLCRKCHAPIKIKRYCPTHGELDKNDIVLGYEIEKGKYVVFEEEEIKKFVPRKTDEIKIVEFVDRDSVDEVLKDKKYYVIPDHGGEDAYFLLQYVLDLTNKVAIGRFVMRNREYVAAILPYRNALLLVTLHYREEIKSVEEFEVLRYETKFGEEEISLARMLTDKLTSEFKIEEFRDEYTEKLVETIKSRAKGETMEVAVEEKEKPRAKNLIELLKASVR